MENKPIYVITIFEKLSEGDNPTKSIADYLLTNGVTVHSDNLK